MKPKSSVPKPLIVVKHSQPRGQFVPLNTNSGLFSEPPIESYLREREGGTNNEFRPFYWLDGRTGVR